MSLLTLEGIGKIYVSEGSVAVGIRGVDLSFNKGEFVAVTGRSGSGKSTLLNVISGMDSYEEGELYIDGEPTSHYMQPDWEEYREKYISFIFQDYNIIESFTVLQNVELALMHIEDKKERRRRALELIDRVGLTSHVRHKGSKLSGGQKQRTVIARALAKDSPIILADEPTGNLDYATSKEIIKLLHEVSRDKLLIVVTHNFEQVEEYATRHIRIFDGAVESDHVITPPVAFDTPKSCVESPREIAKAQRKKNLRNGITLGRTIFTAKPRLSLFLCILMIVGTMGIFLMTSLCGSAADIFDKHYMFEPVEGRLVIAKQSGEVITDGELESLVSELGAESSLHYDLLLDQSYSKMAYFYNEKGKLVGEAFKCVYGENFGKNIVGEYPDAPNEVLLYLPISYRPTFGSRELKVNEITYNQTKLTITGVKYFYDNNLDCKLLFTEEGFRIATAANFITGSGMNISVSVSKNGVTVLPTQMLYSIYPSFEVEKGKIYIDHDAYRNTVGGSKDADDSFQTTVSVVSQYYSYNYYYGSDSTTMTFAKDFGNESITHTLPADMLNSDEVKFYSEQLIVHPDVLLELSEGVLAKSYKQASLFFENDKAAEGAVDALKAKGYIAVPADTTYSPDALTTILSILGCIALAFVWLLTLLFLAFFINLCSTRALAAFKNDMSIMRSMGISVRVIRIGMYVRMLMSLIPAFVMVILSAILIFTTPLFNQFFTYLYFWQYAVIFAGMLILTVRITHKQIRKLFRVSVKKSLKGGAAE